MIILKNITKNIINEILDGLTNKTMLCVGHYKPKIGLCEVYLEWDKNKDKENKERLLSSILFSKSYAKIGFKEKESEDMVQITLNSPDDEILSKLEEIAEKGRIDIIERHARKRESL